MAAAPQTALEKIAQPELIFGLVAPIGVNLDAVTQSITSALHEVRYDASVVRLTTDMTQFELKLPLDGADMVSYYEQRINYANGIRAKLDRDDALALLAIASIRRERRKLTTDENAPAERRAYIVRQLKRPEEIDLLRRTYGEQFITVCAYQPEEERLTFLVNRERGNKYAEVDEHTLRRDAKTLIDRDYAELQVRHGQRMRDAFPKGDLYLNASDETALAVDTLRFIKAFFGWNKASPTKEEYGMYLAKSASFRSLDLSRQVGASVMTKKGEILALGTNEVPKSGGGTYWDPEKSARDIFIGYDPNEVERTHVLGDIVKRLKAKGVLSPQLSNLLPDDILRKLLDRDDSMYIGDAKILDILEFGRIVHAEMSAICDAARLGRALEESILFTTTFPCHICAKHIVASGVREVVFMEPYPKSHALTRIATR